MLLFLNANLKNFEFKKVFAWHCSIWINLKLKENGMPTTKETEIIKNFRDKLNKKIKGEGKKEKPNALFLAKITWKESCEIIWRVFNLQKNKYFF